ncbi:NAD(P)H-dependent oxidoreductase subunit E [Amaricoccus sp.]|uniref:NAD(P)H-dependent oxidoreductase subunit E n=1 Tax=Amaricoccus sp. TaxID=1872485 RepID=UPI0026262237|nr:NAD(P)H-dependent oxidoreductase subunit E [uncultured Amaricoccus sp.]
MLDETDAQAQAAAAICARYGNDPAELLEILHTLVDERGFVADSALPVIAHALNLGRAEVHGVVSFYHDFRREPAGRLVVKICRAESCQSMGATALIERICQRYNVALGETSRAGLTLEPVYCLGLCAHSPAALIGDRPVGRLTVEKFDAAVAGALA